MMVPHIVVIGCGLSGLISAYEAAIFGGVRVTVVDKESKCGGNSARASSGLNAPSDEDSASFLSDTLKSCGGRGNVALAEKLVSESRSSFQALESIGINLPVLRQLGGHMKPRTWAPAPSEGSTGAYLVAGIQAAIIRDDSENRVSFLFKHSLSDVQFNSGAVAAVTLVGEGKGKMKLPCDALIVATGGFAGSREALLKHAPGSINPRQPFTSTNGLGASGDGLDAVLRSTSAATVDMGFVQFHPTGFVDLSAPGDQRAILCPEAWRGAGALLIDPATGKRFVNELAPRPEVSAAIAALPSGEAWIILPPASALDSGTVSALLGSGFYESKGLLTVVRDGTLDNLAAALDIPQEVLLAEVAAHDRLARASRASCPEACWTGKTTFPAFFAREDHPQVDTWTAAKVRPAAHHTMGGIVIDTDARVLVKDSPDVANEECECPRAIPGLYACGEVTGGVHGASRLGGNALLDCVVFGRTAGKNAAAWAWEKSKK